MAKHHENRCVMFSNYSDGLSSLVYQTTFELKVRAYSFRITKDGVPDVINAFSCIENGTEIRTVYTMKDPRWIFYSQGETQWFEDSELYKCRITKKRLDEKILITYCTRLGFDISNDTFWKSEQSILLERLAW